MMKQAYSSRKYTQLIQWIALNDDTETRDFETIAQYLTVYMIARVYNLKVTAVAQDVLNEREKRGA